ncbi:MAG: tautomerase family protein [Spirochaetales bacterium]|nr:tautomerase family protein [Spirochaetales bacterium]
MPLVKLHILKNAWTREEKEGLHDAVHRSLESVFKIPSWDFNQRLFEFDGNDWKIPPGKSDKYVLIEISVFPGRKKHTKKMLYADMVAGLERLGVPKTDCLILLIEQPLENWGIRGGIPADEVDLGYSTVV